MTGKSISLDYVVSQCSEYAFQQQLAASRTSRTKEPDKHTALLGRADAGTYLADFFRNADLADHLHANPEVENLAREIDPDAFASYDAMIARLKNEGSDHSYAMHVAEAAYGERLETARSKASESIETAGADSESFDAFTQGLEAAIAWHESQAIQADAMERRETVRERKIKFNQRAQRHRLYAKHIRHDLVDQRRAEREASRSDDRSQPSLPLLAPTQSRDDGDHIPIEVQMRYLKKTEVMDDEGF